MAATARQASRSSLHSGTAPKKNPAHEPGFLCAFLRESLGKNRHQDCTPAAWACWSAWYEDRTMAPTAACVKPMA